MKKFVVDHPILFVIITTAVISLFLLAIGPGEVRLFQKNNYPKILIANWLKSSPDTGNALKTH